MKFLLAPLLVIGMCVSFTAAMVAMLFATGKIQSVEELEASLQLLYALLADGVVETAAFERWRPRLAPLLAAHPGDLRSVLRRLYDEASYDVEVQGAS